MLIILLLLIYLQFSSLQQPYIANLDEHCMQCLCIAATGCNRSLICEGGYCGPYKISKIYWIEAGKVVHEGDTPDRGLEAYEDCAIHYECAQRIVKNYLLFLGKDCNGDGRTDCDDYLMINFNGGYSCDRNLNRNEAGRSWLSRYKICNPSTKLILQPPLKRSTRQLTTSTARTTTAFPKFRSSSSSAPEISDLASTPFTINTAERFSTVTIRRVISTTSATIIEDRDDFNNNNDSFISYLDTVYPPNLISPGCRRCICNATTSCNKPMECSRTCGPFELTRSYWINAGRPLPFRNNNNNNDDDQDFKTCATDVFCAAQTVDIYMQRFSKDCNNDGKIDCDDFALLHRFGTDLCERSDFSDNYGKKYLNCKNMTSVDN